MLLKLQLDRRDQRHLLKRPPQLRNALSARQTDGMRPKSALVLNEIDEEGNRQIVGRRDRSGGKAKFALRKVLRLSR
jgi:hypothetical protein